MVYWATGEDDMEPQRATAIMSELARLYPEAKPELEAANPFEVLVATILSAQCTDRQVNKVTPALFERAPTPEAMLTLTQDELEGYVKSCGVYRNKAKNILATCSVLVERYGGQVPGDLEAMQALPGVGRKTANVVLANAFGGDAIAVDTHVFRVSNRLGLSQAKNVVQTEEQLMEILPKSTWSTAHHQILWHGRRVCKAQRPLCGQCTLNALCAYPDKA